jgi:hypothetical protein
MNFKDFFKRLGFWRFLSVLRIFVLGVSDDMVMLEGF